jgi:hypothetical protein
MSARAMLELFGVAKRPAVGPEEETEVQLRYLPMLLSRVFALASGRSEVSHAASAPVVRTVVQTDACAYSCFTQSTLDRRRQSLAAKRGKRHHVAPVSAAAAAALQGAASLATVALGSPSVAALSATSRSSARDAAWAIAGLPSHAPPRESAAQSLTVDGETPPRIQRFRVTYERDASEALARVIRASLRAITLEHATLCETVYQSRLLKRRVGEAGRAVHHDFPLWAKYRLRDRPHTAVRLLGFCAVFPSDVLVRWSSHLPGDFIFLDQIDAGPCMILVQRYLCYVLARLPPAVLTAPARQRPAPAAAPERPAPETPLGIILSYVRPYEPQMVGMVLNAEEDASFFAATGVTHDFENFSIAPRLEPTMLERVPCWSVKVQERICRLPLLLAYDFCLALGPPHLVLMYRDFLDIAVTALRSPLVLPPAGAA